MIRRPPRSTLSSSSAASDVYKRQLPALKRSRCPRAVGSSIPQGCDHSGYPMSTPRTFWPDSKSLMPFAPIAPADAITPIAARSAHSTTPYPMGECSNLGWIRFAGYWGLLPPAEQKARPITQSLGLSWLSILRTSQRRHTTQNAAIPFTSLSCEPKWGTYRVSKEPFWMQSKASSSSLR